jgi:hypothetical protein
MYFQILRGVPNPISRITVMIQKLQDVMDPIKEPHIIVAFAKGRYPPACRALLDYHYQVKLLGTSESQWLEGLFAGIQTFYSEISFLLNEGISATCHNFILKYYFFIFTSVFAVELEDGYLLFIHTR